MPSILGTPAGRFRVVAIAEAISWAALLIGMFFKYVVVENEVGVQIFGPIHGAIFVLYVIVALLEPAHRHRGRARQHPALRHMGLRMVGLEERPPGRTGQAHGACDGRSVGQERRRAAT